MKKVLFLFLIIISIACAKDEAVSTIPNATWVLDKITFSIDDSEDYELLDPPDVRIDILDNTFSYSDNGTKLNGSWNLDQAAKELRVTNPDGKEIIFPFISVTGDSWTFVAKTIDLSKSEFNIGEEASLDMVNRKFIEEGKDLDTELSGASKLEIVFVMKKLV